MAHMIKCQHCGRLLPKLIDAGFAEDEFETIDRHLCVSPSVKTLLRDKEEALARLSDPPAA